MKAKPTGDMTVAELERILNSRRAALKDLVRKRAQMQRDMDKIDAEIRVLSGAPVRGRGARTRNKVSLRQTVLGLLKKNKKGYSLAELSELILQGGYKTTSTNFRNVIYQCLYNTSGIYHDDTTRTYRYREPDPKGKPPQFPET